MFQTNVVEKVKNTHFVFSNFFYENLSIYEIMWKNGVEADRPQKTVRQMRNAGWILKLHPPTQYAKLTAFPL